jgi:threonine dehydrogenase-like Zn-dependent dehydrogenase
MRALAVFPQRREIRFIDQTEPRELGPRQVAIRVREVGICGTDREIASFQYGAPPAGADHFVLGHEALAEVEAVGGGVEHLRSGQLVVPLVRLPCGDAGCHPCRAGRQDFCVTGRFRERGIKEADGFLVERTVDEEGALIPVPAALAEVGVLVEPLTIAAKGIFQIRRFKDRLPWDPLYQRALVLGAGPVGLLAAMAAVANGYETFVYSREPSGSDRALFVEAFGARYASSLDVPEPSGLAAMAGPFQVVVEATGHSPLAFGAIAALGPNGIFVFTGVPAQRPPTLIDTDRLMKDIVLKNQLLFGTVNAGRDDYGEAIRLLEQFMGLFPDSVRRLITSHTPLDEAPALLSHGSDIKGVVTVTRS